MDPQSFQWFFFFVGFTVFYSYTLVYNVLNFAAGVVPVTTVTREDMERLQDYPADCDGQRVLKRVSTAVCIPFIFLAVYLMLYIFISLIIVFYAREYFTYILVAKA